MNLAAISLGALFAAILLSCFTRLNVGIPAIAMAWLLGVYLGGFPLKEILAGFPSDLFLTLAGVTLLFAQTQGNGTLDGMAQRIIRSCRGNTGLLPVLFFLSGAGLASLGPGNIATAALLAPAAMAAAQRLRISPFLMAIMVGNGANAGSLSPLAPAGIIVNGLMDRIGLGGHALSTWLSNLAAHAAVAFLGYLLFGGWRLFRLGPAAPSSFAETVKPLDPFTMRQWLTMALLAALVGGVLILRLPIGMASFTVAGILSVARLADDGDAIRRMPWQTLLMVCGMTLLIALLERTQGIELFASLIARLATPQTATAVVAFLTGLVSAYSSTSGVVLPAFLPTIPSLLRQLGGVDALALAASMNIGGHLVDVSPLSTIGALCLAGVTDPEASRRLFHQLLAWGLSMCAVAALFCWLFFR